MIADDDWRLTGQEAYLSGVALQWRAYHPPSATWDHDHCEFCSATFMEAPQPETLHAGYATLDAYHWICAQCFADFAERFEWHVVGSSSSTTDPDHPPNGR